MQSKLIYLILILVLVFTLINFVDSCNERRTTNKILIDQLKRNDSLEVRLKELIAVRRDSVIIITNNQKEIIKEGEKKKNEIINTNNIDSLRVLYYRYRPDNFLR